MRERKIKICIKGELHFCQRYRQKKEAREDEKVFRVWKLMLTTEVDTFTEKRHGSLFKKLRGITNDS